MKFIKAVSSLLSIVERSIIVGLLGVMVLLAFLQVILRNVFSTGLLWADPFLRHLVLWVGFLGASLATQQEKHINIDLITRFLSPKHTNIIRIITNLFASIVCSILAHAGWTFLLNEMESPEVLFTIGELPFSLWWFQIIIPFGFGLMAFRFLIRTIEHIIGIFHPPSDKSPETNIPVIEV